MPVVPDSHRPLLEEPLIGHLATIRPDNTAQVTPMWFEYDGTHVRFTHTSARQKFRNLQHNPSMALSVTDPADPERYIEVAGTLTDVVPDPDGAYFVQLSHRYGNADATPPADKANRVVLVMTIDRTSTK
ncbi:PPOX class F420-dependent oxidoreductase [Cryptosporangium sp. NPDC048952]|uniref:PPOX class F420-dependent oxidoreductase n=1 Tax=Cryptosporangium sp. NPDC048952 TaxID=3363961 RepID=UPI00371C9662